MFFFKLLLYQLSGHAVFFGFLVSVINHYHINELHLFWDSFEWFCLQISSDAKYFCPLLSKALWSRINSCYRMLFLIWCKNEHNIISWAISSYMGAMYIETPYIWFEILFTDNILQWAWALFYTLLTGFKYCNITVTSVLCLHSLFYLTHQ